MHANVVVPYKERIYHNRNSSRELIDLFHCPQVYLINLVRQLLELKIQTTGAYESYAVIFIVHILTERQSMIVHYVFDQLFHK